MKADGKSQWGRQRRRGWRNAKAGEGRARPQVSRQGHQAAAPNLTSGGYLPFPPL